MTTPLKHCLVASGLAILTHHTQKRIIENQSVDQFLIPPTWTHSACLDALLEWVSAASTMQEQSRIIAWANQLSKPRTRSGFASELDQQLTAAFFDKAAGPIKPLHKIYHGLLIALWTKGCLIWPSENSVAGWPSNSALAFNWASAQGLVKKALDELSVSEPPRIVHRCRRFFRLLLSRSLIDNILDVGPRSDTQPPSDAPTGNDVSAVAKMLVSLQRQARPSADHHDHRDFIVGNQPKRGCRSDPEFKWAVESDHRWSSWRKQATDYLAMLRRGRAQAISALNAFLDYAIANQIPDEPRELFLTTQARSYPAFPTGRSVDNARNAMLKRFLTHVLDGVRHELLLQGHHHQAWLAKLPLLIPEPTAIPNPVQSHRDPMPQHLVKLCLQILTENDYAWPKSFMERGDSDWINRIDPATGQNQKVWSPVRASVLIAKLLLPARTMQIRMLDSGEADTERYDPSTRSWQPNTNALARKGRVEKGVFRAYPREDGSRGSLIYFNTNKTADINLPLHKRGHLMAWEHEEALTLFASLRDWQQKFNPLAAPTPWEDLAKQRSETPMDLAARGTACFLFRDPTQPNPTLPISNGKVQAMWSRLMEEAERRLAAEGERRPDGSPIQLVLSRRNGMPGRLAYDLHSLRVTMITALYDRGVPVDRLMKIAGHCATVMTLYYVKESREKVSLALTEANRARSLPESISSEWSAFLKQSKELPPPLSVSSNPQKASPRSRVIFMDKGLCLAGGQCPTNKSAGLGCSGCEHFATGPAFLPGLQHECEELLQASCSAAEAYQNADAEVESIRLSKAKGEHVGIAKSEGAELRLQRCVVELDQLNEALMTTQAWVQECVTLAATDARSPILVTSPDTARRILQTPTANTDRVLSAIHQTACIHQRIVTMPAPQQLLRLRFLNRLLTSDEASRKWSFQINESIQAVIFQQMELWARLRSARTNHHSLPEPALQKSEQTTIKWEVA